MCAYYSEIHVAHFVKNVIKILHMTYVIKCMETSVWTLVELTKWKLTFFLIHFTCSLPAQTNVANFWKHHKIAFKLSLVVCQLIEDQFCAVFSHPHPFPFPSKTLKLPLNGVETYRRREYFIEFHSSTSYINYIYQLFTSMNFYQHFLSEMFYLYFNGKSMT